MNRKGIILAGGSGSRLYPLTKVLSKQLMNVYDKPMIYYPLTTLMLCGIRDFLIITTKRDLPLYEELLGDGKLIGINIEYKIQAKPDGIAQAFILGEDFLNGSPCVMILGDNLYHGNYLIELLVNNLNKKGASIFAYSVSDPERYCVVDFDKNKNILSLEEKPENPKSVYAVTGIYFYDADVCEKAKLLKLSDRGELEITDLNKIYLREKKLNLEIMGRGVAWLDTGTFDSLHNASSYIRTIEKRQGLKIGSPEEAAFRKGWISKEELKEIAAKCLGSNYSKYLMKLAKTNIIDTKN